MSLGKCPTCGGSVSVNADSCTQCGETSFLTEETIPYGRVQCTSCQGAGYCTMGGSGPGYTWKGKCNRRSHPAWLGSTGTCGRRSTDGLDGRKMRMAQRRTRGDR